MAIDTRNKRLSVLGYGLGLRPLPTPDGSWNTGDRQSVSFDYAGVSSFHDWTVRASMLSLDLTPWRTGLFPDGTISAKDRQMIRGLYWNIPAASPSGTTIVISHTIGRAIGRALGRSL